jgi:hypothetical protein
MKQSTCCSAPVSAVIADEGTGHWECSKCGEACDVKRERINGKKIAKLAKKVAKSWEEEDTLYFDKIVYGVPPKIDKKHFEPMLKSWKQYQQENEDALHTPWIDVGRVCIALGWGLLWMGCGLIIGVRI